MGTFQWAAHSHSSLIKHFTNLELLPPSQSETIEKRPPLVSMETPHGTLFCLFMGLLTAQWISPESMRLLAASSPAAMRRCAVMLPAHNTKLSWSRRLRKMYVWFGSVNQIQHYSQKPVVRQQLRCGNETFLQTLRKLIYNHKHVFHRMEKNMARFIF